MRKLQRIFIVAVCVCAVVFIASTVASAQMPPPNYLYLQAIDSKGKPVAGAQVEQSPFYKEIRQTDKKGEIRLKLSYQERDFGESIYKISKAGYFAYQDFGFSLTARYQYRTDDKIELLKIPQTKAERAAVGQEQTKREFMWAAKTGDAATIRRLLKSGVNPNLTIDDLRGVPHFKGVSAVLLAAASGSGETVKVFLDAGVNIREKNEIRAKSEIHTKDEFLPGILIAYVQADPFFWRKPRTDAERKETLRRYEDGIKTLIDAGADTSALDGHGLTAIMLAAYKGKTETVKTLLSKGFSVNAANVRGETVLEWAVNREYDSEEISKVETVNALLEAGAAVNSPSSECSPALLVAARLDDTEVLKTLIKSDAKTDGACGANGDTALLAAIESHRSAAARVLIEAGADVNFKRRGGASVLMIAAAADDEKRAEIVRALLDKRALIDARDDDGKTALMYAVRSSWYVPNSSMVSTLLAAGADPNAVAGKNQDLETCETPLIIAAEQRAYKTIQILTVNKADINLPCGNGDTVLVYAIKKLEPELVAELLKAGADPKSERVRLALEHINRIKLFDENSGKRRVIEETIKTVEAARAK